MTLALEQARQAASLGEVPVGAVLVQQGQVIGTGFNHRETRQDPTAHAEVIAIREGAARLKSWRLLETTLYVTLEPCIMCAGAIWQARITRVVFGTFDPKAGAYGSILNLHLERRLNHHVEVVGPLLEEACRATLRTFFHALRQAESTTAQPQG
ncbi:MAG: nucleoside deaminase [Nitrospirae bacterium]|nr:MAG: nucleoside deaminase [Nitrospirota bacterium]